MAEDEGVRSTNDDASACKRSAVERGYWRDPYIQYFIRSGDRKVPEINRGYYARVRGIRSLILQFFELTKGVCQVVNLGAGFDTTYWNLKDDGFVAKNFVEVDFPEITTKKCFFIRKRKELFEKLSSQGEVEVGGSELHSADYHLVSADLRRPAELLARLAACHIDTALPTLFLAECVLVYMPGALSAGLLRALADTFSTALFINYEQVNMGDRFGEVMVENLKQRDCELAGVEHCGSLQTQMDRFTSVGWDGAQAMDMVDVYKLLDQVEIQRTDGLQLLQQLRQQLFSHHCICWSHKDGRSVGLAGVTLRAAPAALAPPPPPTSHLRDAIASHAGPSHAGPSPSPAGTRPSPANGSGVPPAPEPAVSGSAAVTPAVDVQIT